MASRGQSTDPSIPSRRGAPRPCTVGQLAEALGLEVAGDSQVRVERVASLGQADADCLAALYDARRAGELADTRAGAVIAAGRVACEAPCPVLLSDNPRLHFGRAAALLQPEVAPAAGVHPSAVVHESARLGEGVSIGAHAVVGPGAELGDGVRLGNAVFIGPGVSLGAHTSVAEGAVLHEGTRCGRGCRIDSNAVLGGEGFGFAQEGSRWERMPQLGGVVLGDEVEVGACTTVDRGSLGDTVLGDRVKLDNLIQIAHNCRIGSDTAMASQVGIAGSTTIGARCTIGGATGFADHIEVADDCHFLGMAMVTSTITEPGVYASGLPATPARQWRRNAMQVSRLNELARRVQALEKRLLHPDDTTEDEE